MFCLKEHIDFKTLSMFQPDCEGLTLSAKDPVILPCALTSSALLICGAVVGYRSDNLTAEKQDPIL